MDNFTSLLYEMAAVCGGRGGMIIKGGWMGGMRGGRGEGQFSNRGSCLSPTGLSGVAKVCHSGGGWLRDVVYPLQGVIEAITMALLVCGNGFPLLVCAAFGRGIFPTLVSVVQVLEPGW